MGSIILSCGCADKPPQSIIYGDYDCDAITGFHPSLCFAEYCADCAQELRDAGVPMFANEAEGDKWLDAQH